MAVADVHALLERKTARRPHDIRAPPGVLHHAAVADPHAVREPGTQRLDDRLLGRETQCEKAHRARLGRGRADVERRALLRHQQPLDEVHAVPAVGRLDPLDAQHVGADAMDQDRRASTISRFISATAGPSPL